MARRPASILSKCVPITLAQHHPTRVCTAGGGGCCCFHRYAEAPTGLAPDSWSFEPATCRAEASPNGKKFSLRPETLESLFYLYRLTRNETYAGHTALDIAPPDATRSDGRR